MDLKDILTSATPTMALREIERAGELETFEPSLAGLKMDIPAGYRHKDNWIHSLKVLENAMEQEGSTPDYILRTAALLHDIGKPATREFHANGVVSFRNHEQVGANMSRKLLKHHGYEKSEISQIERIIALHMRAHGFAEVSWSDSAVRRLMADAGSEDALDRLIVVFYSDLTTTNVKKKARIERGIAKLEESFARVKAVDERKAMRPALDGYEVMEMTGLKQGRSLGLIMKFLNSDEGVRLTRDDAIDAVNSMIKEM